MSKCVDSVRSLGSYYEESKKYIGNRQKQEGLSLKVFVCKYVHVYIKLRIC